MRKRFSPGIVLGLIAVVFAMSGSAYAASKITSAQIKDGTIVAKDIKDDAITPAKLSNSAMTALAGDTGPTGPSGPTGPAGPQGPAGPSALGAITLVNSSQVAFGPDVVKSATAFCPAGQRVVSGGGVSISDEQLAASQATSDRTGWFVIGVDTYDNGGEYVQAQALCAPAGVAVASSASHTRAERDVASAVKKVQAGSSRSKRSSS
jgi:hypothetical protein